MSIDAADILEERARALARPPVAAAEPADTVDVLLVTLGTERYAVGVEHLQEVLPAGALTPVPGTPVFVLGVTNVRGRVLAVLDLAPVLGAAAGDDPPAHLVVVEAGGMTFGIAAGDVEGPVRRERADLAADLVTELDLDGLVAERRLEVGR